MVEKLPLQSNPFSKEVKGSAGSNTVSGQSSPATENIFAENKTTPANITLLKLQHSNLNESINTLKTDLLQVDTDLKNMGLPNGSKHLEALQQKRERLATMLNRATREENNLSSQIKQGNSGNNSIFT